MQRHTEELSVGSEPSLHIFEDLTGSGKTEAALAAAQRMREAAGGGSLLVALPTMATANAMFDRMGKAYARLFAQGSRPSLVLAHSARHLHTGFRDSIGLETLPASTGIAAEESAQSLCAAWNGLGRCRGKPGA